MDIITENVHNVNIANVINEHFFMCVERDGEGGEKGEKEGGRMGKIGGSGKMQEKVGLGKGLVERGVAGEEEKKGLEWIKGGEKWGESGLEWLWDKGLAERKCRRKRGKGGWDRGRWGLGRVGMGSGWEIGKRG